LKRLLVIDLDGTLIDRRDNISEEKLLVLNELKNYFDITIATGRSYLSALYFVKLLNIKIPFICFDGSLIIDIYGNEIYSEDMKFDEVYEILNFLKKFKDVSINIFYRNFSLVNENMLSLGVVLKHWKIEYKIFNGDLYLDKIYKIVVASYNFDVLNSLKAFLKNYRNKGFYFYPSGKKKGLYVSDISNRNSNKGNALKILKEKFNYNFIVSIGDYINDLEMFEVSDIKIAPFKSHKVMKEKADFLISSFTDLREILRNFYD